jgi:PhoH-like ATPase
MHSVGGEELGFLPGTEAEKMDPWARAVYSALGGFLDAQAVKELKESNLIEVRPLTHIRGETFNDTFYLVDEAQNLERATIMSALSRIGASSKAVLSWDVSQRDNYRVGRYDGIYECVSRMQGQKLFGHVSLQKSMRSEAAEMVSNVLDDFEF